MDESSPKDQCRIELDSERQYRDALLAGPAVRVDLAGAQEVDSSALSLLLEWARAARAAGGRLTFENLPANLQALARLYGVLELLEPAG